MGAWHVNGGGASVGGGTSVDGGYGFFFFFTFVLIWLTARGAPMGGGGYTKGLVARETTGTPTPLRAFLKGSEEIESNLPVIYTNYLTNFENLLLRSQ